MATKNRTRWTKNVMRVYQVFPASFRSKYWPEIVKAANSGNVDAAMAIARDHQSQSKTVKAQNIIARRIKIQRVALYALQRQSESRLRAVFQRTADNVAAVVAARAKSPAAVPGLRTQIHISMVDLRISLRKELTDIIWQSLLLGVKNMGAAIKPIIRAHQESFAEEMADIVLMEGKLTVGLTYQITGKNNRGRDKATVDLGSDRWNQILNRLYTNIVDKNNEGLTPSERVWDLTNRLEMDLKRRLVTGIANGTAPRDIATDLTRYIYGDGSDEDSRPAPGVYRSPFKNAMRLARTETSRAYSDATAAWADSKSWITGIQPTLSQAHDTDDECDDYAAGDPMDPSEFADTFPVHPHCMCYGTYVIKDEYLTGPGETDNSDAETQAGTDEEA
jgi:hypothetical protein